MISSFLGRNPVGSRTALHIVPFQAGEGERDQQERDEAVLAPSLGLHQGRRARAGALPRRVPRPRLRGHRAVHISREGLSVRRGEGRGAEGARHAGLG